MVKVADGTYDFQAMLSGLTLGNDALQTGITERKAITQQATDICPNHAFKILADERDSNVGAVMQRIECN